MSFLSTTDILKYLVSCEDVLMNYFDSDAFKKIVKELLDDDCIPEQFMNVTVKKLVSKVSKEIFSNTDFRDGVRAMIIEVLADMNIKDEVDKK